jgi:hypothetical protein
MGQNTSPRIVAGLTAGYAVPVGAFSQTDFNDPKSGFAEDGVVYGLHVLYKLEKNYGVCGSIRMGEHPLDVKALANGYATVAGGKFNVSSTRWTRTDTYAGAFVSIPINRLHIDVKLTPGITAFNYPEIVAQSDQISLKQSGASVKSIGFCAGINIRYTISNSFTAMVQAETMRNKPQFKVDVEFNGVKEVYEVDQPYSIHSFGIGFAYNIP